MTSRERNLSAAWAVLAVAAVGYMASELRHDTGQAKLRATSAADIARLRAELDRKDTECREEIARRRAESRRRAETTSRVVDACLDYRHSADGGAQKPAGGK